MPKNILKQGLGGVLRWNTKQEEFVFAFTKSKKNICKMREDLRGGIYYNNDGARENAPE